MKTLLTIDIGTSSTKVSLFSVHGDLLTSYQESYRLDYLEPGWAEQDPQSWWEAACRGSDRVIRAVGTPTVAAVVVSGAFFFYKSSRAKQVAERQTPSLLNKPLGRYNRRRMTEYGE